MSQTLNKVNSGDPLRIPATAYNAFVEAALAHRQSQQNITGGSKTPLPSNALNLVKVKNDSGTDVPQYGILGIGGSVFDPATAALDQWKTELVLSGVAVSNSAHAGGRFVICAQHIKTGMIGLAWAGGVCPVSINVISESHSFATVDETAPNALKSALSGPCFILWKQTGTGVKYGVVRFGIVVSSMECFYLTNVSTSPMKGIHIVPWLRSGPYLNFTTGPLGTNVDIYPHPSSYYFNYRANIENSHLWARNLQFGDESLWVAAEMTNIPLTMCGYPVP
jgi:hypothetical protein